MNMRRFIFQILVFMFFLSGVFIWICSKADGYTDPFYIRFTTPKQENLILGTSRAAQGLQPAVFQTILNKQIYNYAFTVAHSPFGSTYLKSIKNKIKPNTKNGTFIITVDPWSLSSWTDIPNDSLSFRELKLCLSNTNIVNLNPNPFYLLKNWNDKYYKILTNRTTKMFLHTNGWLEVNFDMDSITVQKKTEDMVRTYRQDHLPNTNFSANRYTSLVETISFLENHGKVYLVRLPIDSQLMEVEKELRPCFTNNIQNAIDMSSGYLDLTKQNDNFRYIDGNHLSKDSGKIVSEIIAKWIRTDMALTRNNIFIDNSASNNQNNLQ